MRLFASGGLAAFYSWHEEIQPEGSTVTLMRSDWQDDESLSLVLGPGIGLEFRFGAIDLSVDLPVAMVLSSDKSTNKTNFQIIPYIPNLACSYRW